MLKYKTIDNQFSNFIINHSEVNVFDKFTFQHYNINIKIPRRIRNSSFNNKIDNIPKRKRLSLKEKINILEQKTTTMSTNIKKKCSNQITSNNNKNSDILDLKSKTKSPIKFNKSSKNILSNNEKNSDILFNNNKNSDILDL